MERPVSLGAQPAAAGPVGRTVGHGTAQGKRAGVGDKKKEERNDTSPRQTSLGDPEIFAETWLEDEVIPSYISHLKPYYFKK